MAINKQGLVESKKQIFRLAIKIRNQILALKNKSPKAGIYSKNIDAIDYTLDKIQEQNRLRNKAVEVGFLLAAKKIECDSSIQKWINTIIDNTNRIGSCINETHDSETYIPSMKDLLEEIRIAKRTFPTLSCRNRVLSITTHKITLSDGENEIELGDFKISFNLDVRFDSILSDMLTIKALNPNPAQGSSSITHPHVDDGILCAGDGDPLIRQALQQGRIEDAFKLVLAVLDNYNDDSPYVHLYEWNGESYYCDECGNNDLTDDNVYSCEFCEHMLCEDCHHNCAGCSRIICMSCVSHCAGCENFMCSKCLSGVCNGCDETFCEECMEACVGCGENRCSECLKECEVCSSKICANCSIECAECSTSMCEDCKTTCENCNRMLCADCSDTDKCNMFAEVK